MLMKWHGLAPVGMYIFALAATAHAECAADPKWLPKTPPPKNDNLNSPGEDCPFYQSAWQQFLFATQPDTQGVPAFIGYKNIEDLFGRDTLSRFLFPQRGRDRKLSLAPRVSGRPNDDRLSPGQKSVIGSDVFQPEIHGLLIDQRGNPVFYGIHVNTAFDDFLNLHNLKKKASLFSVRSDLQFTKGIVELKSAWQIVEDPPPDYITAQAIVPMLRIRNHVLIADNNQTRTVTVALLALHVVFVLDGHPEFIWSTFEHVDATSHMPDLAPSAATNPPSTGVISTKTFTLYKAGVSSDKGNIALVTAKASDPHFNETTQKFRIDAQTVPSIYRVFPGSDSKGPAVDDEVKALNDSMTSLFASSSAGDRRRNYRLIGGVWLKNPQSTFKNKTIFSDGDLQGEDRLSNLAMESFTQQDFPHCFKCHNTTPVIDPDTGKMIIPAKLLNVSHILSKFLSSHESSEGPGKNGTPKK